MWQKLVAVNAAKRAITFHPFLYRLARKFSPMNPLRSNALLTAHQAVEMVERLAAIDSDLKGKTVLEIGSGWMPIMPLVFLANGAAKVVATDIYPYMTTKGLEWAKQFLRDECGEKTGEAIAAITDLGDESRLTYRAPNDFATIAAGSIDVITSRTVLEHVRIVELPGLLAQCHRVLRPDGMMCHRIDYSDHRAHVDQRLSNIDFLRYSDGMWRLIDAIWTSHQNRLRWVDFPPYFEEAGFDVVGNIPHINEARAHMVPIASRFKDYNEYDLRVSGSLVILRKR